MSAPAISLCGVGVRYGQREVLRDVSFSADPGRMLGVLGRSGCGKSTLLQLIAGLSEADAGTVQLDGRSTRAAERRGLGGLVPQQPALLPWRTVAGNLMLALELRREGGPGARQQVTQLLTRFGLRHAADLWPHQLSGGMGQRVAVLRAALFARDLLLLDEPFSALDALTRLEFQGWLRAVQRQGLQQQALREQDLQQQGRVTAILVTHDVREALALCDRVVVLGGQPASVVLTLDLPTAGERGWALERELLAALQAEPIPPP